MGFNGWQVKVKGLRKAIRNAQDSDEGAKALGEVIYNILSSKEYIKYFASFEMVHGWDLEDFALTTGKEDLNNMLDEFYDYCDEVRIWIAFD